MWLAVATVLTDVLARIRDGLLHDLEEYLVAQQHFGQTHIQHLLRQSERERVEDVAHKAHDVAEQPGGLLLHTLTRALAACDA